MTDLDKLKALLTEFGVGFEVEATEDGTSVTCSDGRSKVSGYAGFFTSFDFDCAGKFKEMGAWE